MMTLLTSTPQQPDVMGTFIKVVIFIYLIPSMIGLIRIYFLKWKFLTILFINIFFGWSVYGWWIAFIKAFSGSQKIVIKHQTRSESDKQSEKYDTLEKLNILKQSGVISLAEFEKEKSKILK